MSDTKSRKSGVAVALAAVMCLASGPTSAGSPDPDTVKTVQDLTGNGAKEFSAGNSNKAVDLLQQAISLIQKSMTTSLVNFLPNPPAGWDAGKVEEGAMATNVQGNIQGYHVSRKYTKKEDKTRVKVEINGSEIFVQGMKERWKSTTPELLKILNRSPDVQTRIVERDTWKGFVTQRKGKRAEAALFVAGGLLTVEVTPDREEILDQFIGMIDLAGLAKALGGVPSAKP